jgi:hypothetical protein
MKSKLYIIGLISISLLTYSCSNDDSFPIPEVENNNFKLRPQSNLKNDLKEQTIDSTAIILNIEINTDEGDPSNPKPPKN